jgi:hypothetical protein
MKRLSMSLREGTCVAGDDEAISLLLVEREIASSPSGLLAATVLFVKL